MKEVKLKKAKWKEYFKNTINEDWIISKDQKVKLKELVKRAKGKIWRTDKKQ